MKDLNNFKEIFSNSSEQTTNVNLGALLQEAREQQKFSLLEVSQKIRIRVHFLEALEKNDFENLPERTYTLGYLKVYASFLKMKNIEEMVQILDESYEFYNPSYGDKINIIHLNNEKKTNHKLVEKRLDNTSNSSQFLGKQYMLVSALIIIILGFLFYIFIYKGTDQDSKILSEEFIANEKLPTDVELVAVDKGIVSNEEKNVVENTTNNSSVNIFANQSESKQVYIPFPEKAPASGLVLFFKDDTWVYIYNRNDPDKYYLDKIFQAGERFVIPTMEEDLVMKVGNYLGVEISVNGKTIKLKSNKRGLVLDNILLNQKFLLETYN